VTTWEITLASPGGQFAFCGVTVNRYYEEQAKPKVGAGWNQK